MIRFQQLLRSTGNVIIGPVLSSSECTVNYAVSPLMGLSRRRSVLEDVAVKHRSRRALFQVVTWQGEPQSTIGVPVTGVDVAEPPVRIQTGCAGMRRGYETACKVQVRQPTSESRADFLLHDFSSFGLQLYKSENSCGRPLFPCGLSGTFSSIPPFSPIRPFCLQHVTSPCGVT